MPIINQPSPIGQALGGILAAAGQVYGNIQKAKAQKQQQQMEQQRQAAQVAQWGVQNQQGQQKIGIEQQQANTQAKTQAAAAVHQVAADALAAAKQQYAIDNDKRNYDLKVKQINQTHQDAQDRIKASTTNEQLRSAATMGAAQIRASTTLQAAGMRESGEDARAKAERGVQMRGQDLNSKRAQETAGATAARFTAGEAAKQNAASVGTLKQNPTFTGLPPGVQSYVAASVMKNGQAKVTEALRAIASGKSQDPNVSADQAKKALIALGYQP